jgi:alpha/beta superfamily hydrolase
MIVLVIRGLLSLLLSRWDTYFVERLENLGVHGAVQTDHGWGVAWFSNVNRMIGWCEEAHAKKEKIVLVGHSFGGTSVIKISQALATRGIAVDFAGPIDPAWQYDTAMGSNVLKCTSFWQREPGQLGGGIIHADHTWQKGEWDKRVDVYRKYETHLQIADDPQVQDRIAKDVAQCLKS